MQEYHKIQTVYNRDPATKFKTLLEGEYSTPEFEYLADSEWVFTEKVDGTNIRVGWGGGEVAFGGRTEHAQIPASLVNMLHSIFTEKRLAACVSACCLYGEGYGAGIQKGGGNYRRGAGFVLFDVRVGDLWLARDFVEDIADNLGVDVVPIVGTGTISQMVEMARSGFCSTWGAFPAEGIVARPEVELCSRWGDRIITKIKHKDFVEHD